MPHYYLHRLLLHATMLAAKITFTGSALALAVTALAAKITFTGSALALAVTLLAIPARGALLWLLRVGATPHGKAMRPARGSWRRPGRGPGTRSR
jgi:hypothetical protein